MSNDNTNRDTDRRAINMLLQDLTQPEVIAAVAATRERAQLDSKERLTILEAATHGDGSLLIECINDLLTIRYLDGKSAGVEHATQELKLHVNAIIKSLPVTSIGPSGIGGEYQSEITPDRAVPPTLPLFGDGGAA